MSSNSTSLTLLLFTIAIATAAAKEFQVGDAVGWRIPVTNETELYNVWASRRRFHIGDSLRFRYKTDSVAVVEKWGFYHCDSSNPISFFNDGDTLFNLDKVGTVYFVSGNADRCNKGQRMIVKVVENRHQLPPSIATPPRNDHYDDGVSPSPSPSQLSGSGGSSGSGLVVSGSAWIMGVAGLGLWLVQP